MMSNFSTLMSGLKKTGDMTSRLHVPENWMQGRAFYGGLSAAICYENAVQRLPDLPPLRSVLISFVGPGADTVDIEAEILRQGRSVAFVNCDMRTDKGLATRASLCFGAARESIFDRPFVPMPDLPRPDQCAPFFPEGNAFIPNFAHNFECRLAKGGRPIEGGENFDHYLWIRHQDKAATDISALLAIADMPPPAMMPMFPKPAPISSMTWMMNLLVNTPQTEDGWWLMQSRAEHAREGYSSQDMLIWNSEGECVITGRQNVAIFI